MTPTGDFQRVLTNNYGQPATAYVVVEAASGPSWDVGMTYHSSAWAESVPPGKGNANDRPVPARGSLHTAVFTNSVSVYSCEVTATIYADGATAGDRDVVALLLARRQRETQERQIAISALTDLGATPTRQQLSRAAMALTRRGRAWNQQHLGGTLPGGDYKGPLFDRVDIAEAIFIRRLRALTPPQAGEKLQAEIARQQAAVAALRASLPHPPQ